MSRARKRILSLALAACLLLTMALALPGPVEVQAADVDIGTADSITIGDKIYFGSAGTTYTTNDITPGMCWVVLEVENGEAWLFAEDVLYENTNILYKRFHDYYTPGIGADYVNQWKYSELCEWLNGDFYTAAFTGEEQAAVNPHTYETEVYVNEQKKGFETPGTPEEHTTPLFLLDLKDVQNSGAAINCRNASAHWWLRSPGGEIGGDGITINPGGFAALVHAFGLVDADGVFLYDAYGIRPAFRLDLSSVLFTSDAGGVSGKPSGLIGGSLAAAQKPAPTSAIKLTVEHDTQTLDVTATTVQETQTDATLAFGYRNATTGPKQWVSCFLENQGSGDDYYGKLVDLSGSPDSGDLSIPLAGVADGTYTLHIFSEQDNGGNHTDFASDPVTMKVSVVSGNGTVSGFTGDMLSDDATLLSVAGQPVTDGGETGAIGDPKTAAISLGYSVEQIKIEDIATAHTNATPYLYSDSGFSLNENEPIPLTPGADTDLYIKVVAEDGVSVLYYHITVTSVIGQYNVKLTANPLQGGKPTATPNPATATQLVTLTANPASGYTFDRWESVSPGVAIASPTQLATTFEMPHDDVEVVAHYTQDSSSGNSGGSIVRSSSTGGSSRSSDSNGAVSTAPVKTQIPDSAFSWDGDRRLTIDYGGITALGLTGIKWDGAETTAYTVHQGSVVVRFDREFIGAQASGEHRIRVEFLNHYGETAVTVDEGATSTDDDGPYDDAFVDGTYNPNTGDGSRSLILLALLGCFGGLALAVWSRRKRV